MMLKLWDLQVNELNSHFDKCQQLLNSISGSLGSKTMVTFWISVLVLFNLLFLMDLSLSLCFIDC